MGRQSLGFAWLGVSRRRRGEIFRCQRTVTGADRVATFEIEARSAADIVGWFASRALLKGLGFEEIGIHRRHGQLDGRWRDCVIVERLLGKGAGE